MLAALACVDAVTIFTAEDTPLEAMKKCAPAHTGEGCRLSGRGGRRARIGRSRRGGRVALVPLLPEKSTSALVKRIRGLGRTD